MGGCLSKLRIVLNRPPSSPPSSPSTITTHSSTSSSLSSSIDDFSQTTLPISIPSPPLPILDPSNFRFTWDGNDAFDLWITTAVAALPALPLPVPTSTVVPPVSDEDDGDTFFALDM